MKSLAMPIGLLALVGTILPPTLFMLHLIPLGPVKIAMFVSAIAWFAAAPFWMKTD